MELTKSLNVPNCNNKKGMYSKILTAELLDDVEMPSFNESFESNNYNKSPALNIFKVRYI